MWQESPSFAQNSTRNGILQVGQIWSGGPGGGRSGLTARGWGTQPERKKNYRCHRRLPEASCIQLVRCVCQTASMDGQRAIRFSLFLPQPAQSHVTRAREARLAEARSWQEGGQGFRHRSPEESLPRGRRARPSSGGAACSGLPSWSNGCRCRCGGYWP